MSHRALLITIALLAASLAGAQELTFLQVSDLHVPHAIAETRETLAALPTGPVEVSAWGITTSAPAFVLSTGDLNEFGGGRGWWEQYTDLWSAIPLPSTTRRATMTTPGAASARACGSCMGRPSTPSSTPG